MTGLVQRDGTCTSISMTSQGVPAKGTVQSAASQETMSVTPDISPPTRPHATSMPSTPSQRPRPGASQPRAPSVSRTLDNTSPHSESSQTPAATRRALGNCKYETGMARARRRVPYAEGPDKMNAEPAKAKKELGADQEQKLSSKMEDLYNRLVPTPDSVDRRQRLIEKLEQMLSGRWPDSAITVNVFGSTGNSLGTSDSDVDICITTDSKEMSRVCSLAELLAKHGMEKVVCVSSAKVPIVKCWDPELQVACDLNVNNPIALENTTLIRQYVSVDWRVRRLAMIVKYWAKRRILNDAALGGTLSSYTWICLTLNFLQTLSPPILPSLQRQAQSDPHIINGVDVSFDHDSAKYKDYGAANKSSLGYLLYQFFRYYGHLFNFEDNVVSVRAGSLIPKREKNWHQLQDNRLCVEEPFNISRNLANTADDTSMRGIHKELRRAFALIADGNLEGCCDQFIYPVEEYKVSEHFVPPIARPVIAQIPPPPPPRRNGKLNPRGGRNTQHLQRELGARRASNPTAARTSPYYLRNLPFQMTTQELQLQAQHQQHLLHDQLFQQYQYLQMQEQELRLRLHQQRQRGLLAQQYQNYTSQDDSPEGSIAGATASSRGPLSAPISQNRFGGASPFLHPSIPVNGIVTNPSSPHLTPALPEARRFSRRTSTFQAEIAGSLRAQSQPARGVTTPLTLGQLQAGAELEQYLAARRSPASSISHEAGGAYSSQASVSSVPYYEANRRPAEYVGYFVGQSPSLQAYPPSASISPLPPHVGLAIQNGGLSPRLMTTSPRSTFNDLTPVTSRSEQQYSAPSNAVSSTNAVQGPRKTLPAVLQGNEDEPVVVNGSMNSPRRRRIHTASRSETEQYTAMSASTSDEIGIDTPSSSEDLSHDPHDTPHSATSPRVSAQVSFGAAAKSVVVNGYSDSLPDRSRKETNVSPSDATLHEAEGNKHLEPVSRPSLGAWKPGRQLSSVQEVLTPSPGQEKSNALSPVNKSPGFAQGQFTPASPKSTKTTPPNPGSGPLALKANGGASPVVAAEGAAPTIGTSWQTQKKKKNKKKTVKSENDASAINAAGGDSLPVDESQIKGG